MQQYAGWVLRRLSSSEWPKRVTLVEVSARDGLQNEATVLSATEKIEFLDKLTECGFPVIEAASFVSPKRVPQMADAASVIKGIRRKTGVLYPVLTPNMRGLTDAIEAGAKEVAVFTAASEEFCKRNLNSTIGESIQEFAKMAEVAQRHSIQMRGYVSCAAGCPFIGRIEPSVVASVTRDLVGLSRSRRSDGKIEIGLGCYEVSIGDTIGVGTAASISRVFEEIMKSVQSERLAAHMHDTYGQGLSNVLTSLRLGVTTIDSSMAGLGGCPFAKGATGNVATEDVLYLLDGLGIAHGVDWEKALTAGKYITKVLKTTNRSKAGNAIIKKME